MSSLVGVGIDSSNVEFQLDKLNAKANVSIDRIVMNTRRTYILIQNFVRLTGRTIDSLYGMTINLALQAAEATLSTRSLLLSGATFTGVLFAVNTAFSLQRQFAMIQKLRAERARTKASIAGLTYDMARQWSNAGLT